MRANAKQLQFLKTAFDDDPYLKNYNTLLQLSEQTGFSDKKIHTWFKHRREKIWNGRNPPTSTSMSKCMGTIVEYI